MAHSASLDPPPQSPSGWLLASVLAAAAFSAGLLLWAIGDPAFSASFLAGLIGLGAILFLGSQAGSRNVAEQRQPAMDVALLRAALDSSVAAVAITDADGTMIAANAAYADGLGGQQGPASLAPAAAAEARRNGRASIDAVRVNGLSLSLTVEVAGTHLVWKFTRSDEVDLLHEAQRLIGGDAGRRLGEAGVMAAIADSRGNILSANRAFVA
ncbi:MAG: hypothetical protein M3Q08_16315, partial [Pseudomonadota bacterium]|nr:hypothetical protein [Pseudomonadota bacterium]